jgi:large subunit ribosomal protein L5
MSDTATYTPRLRAKYTETIRAAMKEKFGYANDMMIPRLDKIVINMGVGEASQDSKKIKGALEDLEACARTVCTNSWTA